MSSALLQKRFHATSFVTSANALSQLPFTEVEIAFAGRSNAGKSSALNLITSQHHLARVSKTPGRTQLINYFLVDNDFYLVDLPGYGYAKVPESMRKHWQIILQDYFAQREMLQGLILLMDCRHPLTTLDQQMLKWGEARQLKTHILLTKADKLSRGAASQTLQKVKQQLKQYQMPVDAQLFSSTSRLGLEQVWQTLDQWLS